MRYGLMLAAVLTVVQPGNDNGMLHAQAQLIETVVLSVYSESGGEPITTFDFPLTAADCGQPKQPAPTQPVIVDDSATLVWDDPANGALDCTWNDDGSGPIFATPLMPGISYQVAMHYENSAGQSPQSNRAGFTRLGAPTVAPGNVRIRPF